MTKVITRLKKFIGIALALVLTASVAGTVIGKPVTADALFDPDKAITYSVFASRNAIDSSFLFIGTYIIHKDALNDLMYEKAKDSAAESGQENIYYKSELADGQWFDVGDIENGVKGISSDGVPESIETINPLYVQYFVGLDGIMRDAKTMLPLNPFDNPDPYDLSSLVELEPIRNQYTSSATEKSISQADFLSNRGSSDSGNLRSDVYYYQLLSTFFSLDLRDENTNKCDQQLQKLNQLYINLKAAGSEEEAQLVYGLMEKVDATRRAIVMSKLSELDENLLNTLYTLASGSYYTNYGNFKDSSSEANKSSQADYTIKLEDSLMHDFSSSNNVSSLIGSLLSRLGISSSDDWWTVLETEKNNKREREIQANEEADNEDWVPNMAEEEKTFAVDNTILDAIGTAISNCSASYTTHQAKALVDTRDVLGHLIYDYSKQIIETVSETELGGPVVSLKHVTNIKEDVISDKEGELSMLKSTILSLGSTQYFASATAGVNAEYASMMSEGARKSNLEDQKTSVEVDRSMIQFLIEALRQRDTAPNALEYVDERIALTEDLLKQIPDDVFKTYAASSVNAHIIWLKQERQKIIDSDESLKSALDKLKDKKAELQKKRDACLDNNDLAGAKAYDAMIAAVDQDIADEGGDGEGSLADALVDKAVDKLADDSNADLAGVAQALADVGAEDKLDELADKAKESGASDDTLNGIQAAKDSLGDDDGGLDADELLSALEGLFGKSIDEMSDNELAIATATVSQIGRTGSEPGKALTKKLSNKMLEKKNKYLFTQYSDSKTTEYINMKTLSVCTSFRYFYDDSKAVATMTSGSKVYIFTRGSNQMYKQSRETEPETMNQKLVYSSDAYISEDDADVYFKCTTEYCVDTNYAVCLTSTMKTKVEDYVEQLKEMMQ